MMLPAHLRNLAGIEGTMAVNLEVPATQRSVLDAIESAYPMLRGTIRDQTTKRRRAFVRYFACGQDVSLESDDSPLPAAVAEGREPFIIIGAIAGG
ncbi:MAG: MoaD/ThiS family protein [Opitutaceae bacterium]